MELHVKGKNLEVNESIRSYAERKLEKLERRVHPTTVVELELAVEKNPSIPDSQVAEAIVHMKGRTLRAREAARRHEGCDRRARRQARPPGARWSRQESQRPETRRRDRARAPADTEIAES